MNPADGASGPINNVPAAEINLGRIDIPSVPIDLPDPSIEGPSLPSTNPPDPVDISEDSVGTVHLPQVTFPTVDLPKPDTFEELNA